MEITTSVFGLLNFFATKQNNGLVPYANFVGYVKSYALYHMDDHPELVPYTTRTDEVLQRELARLSEEKQVCVVNSVSGSKIIIVIQFYIERFTERYHEMEYNPSISFPLVSELPKRFPADTLFRQTALEFLSDFIDAEEAPSNLFYGIIFPQPLPEVLVPYTVPVSLLLNVALNRMQRILRRDELRDYFLKKLKIANPGREISVRSFFEKALEKISESIEFFRDSSDFYFFWNQLCFFAKQNYEKIKDLTADDIATLQSVYLIEVAINYFRIKAQQDLQRERSFNELKQLLEKPPYYFDYADITRFSDSHGVPLLGQYTEEELKSYLQQETTTAREHELPTLLTFVVDGNHRYFIAKTKALPLVARLCTDAHDTIRRKLIQDWFDTLRNSGNLPEMHEQDVFERKLERILSITSPVLLALLHSSFLPVLHYEAQHAQLSGSKLNLFRNGNLLPFSELLMLSRQEILADAKILLPFWYTIPILSFIISIFMKFFARDPDVRRRIHSDVVQLADDMMSQVGTKALKRIDLKTQAANLEALYVPESSTLEREIAAYLHQWNKFIDDERGVRLTAEVNGYIRGYMERIINAMPAVGFTHERVHELAQTMLKAPCMQGIREKEQLCMYIELYIVQLVKKL